MDSFDKRGIAVIVATVIGFLLIIAAVVGPHRCSRYVQSWHADAYGSNWLVVQYAVDGSVISSWYLVDKSIGSEGNSDGIYFTDNDGNVVHLSGHYIYVQTTPESIIRLKERLLKY